MACQLYGSLRAAGSPGHNQVFQSMLLTASDDQDPLVAVKFSQTILLLPFFCCFLLIPIRGYFFSLIFRVKGGEERERDWLYPTHAPSRAGGQTFNSLTDMPWNRTPDPLVHGQML